MQAEIESSVRTPAAVDTVLVPGLALAAIGLLEWTVVANGGHGRVVDDVRSVLAIVATYGGVGLGLGFVAAIPMLRRIPQAGLGLVLTVATLAAWIERNGIGGSLLIAGLVAWALWRITCGLARLAPVLLGPRGVAPVCGLLLAGCLARVAWRGSGSQPGEAVAHGLLLTALVSAVFLAAGVRWPRLYAIAGLIAIVGSALHVARPLPLASEIAAHADPPSILLISIDTLRADHVGIYGHERARTPNIDALAREGIFFEEATTNTPWTLPSHTTMLTGLRPEEHGVTVNGMSLSREIEALPDRLRAEGYLTAAFVSAWPLEGNTSRLADHFDLYDDDPRDLTWLPYYAYRTSLLSLAAPLLESSGLSLSRPSRSADATRTAAVDWLARGPQTPFFLFVHFYDPHLPYAPPADLLPAPPARPFGAPIASTARWYGFSPEEKRAVVGDPEAIAYMDRLYDAEIARVDREIAPLLSAAREAAEGRLAVILTADHGESFGEHGNFYGRDLYDSTSRIPFILVPPEPIGLRGGVRIRAQLLDVAPTALKLAGVEDPWKGAGRDLVAAVRKAAAGGEEAAARGDSVTALMSMHPETSRGRWGAAVRQDGFKLIVHEGGFVSGIHWEQGSRELYDLENDPLELHDLAGQGHPEEAVLRRRLAPLVSAEHGDAEVDLDPEERSRLKALGYLR